MTLEIWSLWRWLQIAASSSFSHEWTWWIQSTLTWSQATWIL